MKLPTTGAKCVLIALAAATSLPQAMAQQTKPQLYVLHTRPSGGCPGLDWHVTVEPNRSLVGFVGWDQMRHMARLEGSVDQAGAFKMNAQEVGGANRKAVVSGTAAGEVTNISINGTGTMCDGKTFQVPRDDGGLEGGGG